LSETTVCYDEKCYEENIREPSLLVHKASIDPSKIKESIDKQKTNFFAKLGFLKPKRVEIDCESVSLFYEPFHFVKARYHIDYYKKNIYSIGVDEKVSEVIVFGQKLIPKSPKRMKKLLKRASVEIKLPAEDRIIHEVAVNIAQDRKGREVDTRKLPSAPAFAEPEKALAEYGEKARKPEFSTNKLINDIREKIVKKPSEAERIVEEVFEVSKNSLIYTPVYEARCRYLKTGEIKIIPISGVTGKPFNP
jgi:hypothetical protein